MAEILDLNVGGVSYTTSRLTLVSIKDSLLTNVFQKDSDNPPPKDSSGRYFIDRDGVLFRYILDYIRNRKLVLPENFCERERLKIEAEYFRIPDMIKLLNRKTQGNLPPLSQQSSQIAVPNSNSKQNSSQWDLSEESGTITIGYRGTFAFGRDGLADVKFRKLSRLLICGKVKLCRRVFGDSLNESRDPDRGESDRYTARFFLKHTYLEQAFDQLLTAGFKLKSSCGTGTNSMPLEGQHQAMSTSQTGKVGGDSEEGRWYHYNEFVWVR